MQNNGYEQPYSSSLSSGGFEVVGQESLAKKRWRWAVRCISRILRIRQKFAQLGSWTRLDRIQALVGHVERDHRNLRYKDKHVRKQDPRDTYTSKRSLSC